MRKVHSKYDADEWIGRKYWRLTVLSPVNHKLKNNTSQWFWRVRCDCGNEKVFRPIEVIKGHIKSCGCMRKEFTPPNKTHNESHTRLHNIWCGMNRRCNPNTSRSLKYGKRGIAVCDEWKDYENFALWARTHGYSDDLTIERIDVNGNYCPQNCTWISLGKQARNRRTTHWVEFQGRKMSLAEACEIANMPYKQVFWRMKKAGWTFERAISEPIKNKQL